MRRLLLIFIVISAGCDGKDPQLPKGQWISDGAVSNNEVGATDQSTFDIPCYGRHGLWYIKYNLKNTYCTKEHIVVSRGDKNYVIDLTSMKDLPPIKGSDPENESVARFSMTIRKAMEILRLSDRDVAHEFDVRIPTVADWRAGRFAPHPLMRPVVYKWILEKTGAGGGKKMVHCRECGHRRVLTAIAATDAVGKDTN